MSESSAQLVTITPEEAARILELENVNNRNIRKSHVERLAGAMRDGHWIVNGETVIYNDNYLLDGQHRLAACVLAGVPFTTWVVSNVPSDAMPSIDKGIARTAGDTLSWAGYKNGNQASAIARRCHALNLGKNLRDPATFSRLDDFVLLDFMKANAEVIDLAIRLAYPVSYAVGLSRTAWGVPIAWISLAGNDEHVIEQFFSDVELGAGLLKGDPRWALREWAGKAARDRRKLRNDESLIAVVKAWNAWLQGDTVKILRVLPTEALPEVVVA